MEKLKQEIRETKTKGLELEREKMKGNHRELRKEAKERGLRKFELVDEICFRS